MKLIDDGRFENDLFIFIIKMASSGLAIFFFFRVLHSLLVYCTCTYNLST